MVVWRGGVVSGGGSLSLALPAREEGVQRLPNGSLGSSFAEPGSHLLRQWEPYTTADC